MVLSVFRTQSLCLMDLGDAVSSVLAFASLGSARLLAEVGGSFRARENPQARLQWDGK